MLKKIIYWILMGLLILYIVYYVITVIIVSVHKEQICIMINPTGEISKGYVNTLKQIQPLHNTTMFDKYIIQNGIKLEIFRNSLSIPWFFWMKC